MIKFRAFMNQSAHASETVTQSKTNAIKETHHAERSKPCES